MKSVFLRAAVAACIATGVSFSAVDASAQALPLHQLRHPNIFFVLDGSASMPFIQKVDYCPFFEASHPGEFVVPGRLSNAQIVRAALTGCFSPNDGPLAIWDFWTQQAVSQFGGFTGVISPFGASLPARRAAVDGMHFSGFTPLNQGLAAAAGHIANFFAANPSRGGEPIIIIIIGDGQGNGPDTSFHTACDGSAVIASDVTNPTAGAAYLAKKDLVCGVRGVQSAIIHTISLEAQAMNHYAAIAKAGRGASYKVDNARAMQRVIQKLVIDAIVP